MPRDNPNPDIIYYYINNYITPAMLDANYGDVWLFGDNLAYRGKGGMARVMRGHPRCWGVPTKWYPSMKETDFFTDEDYPQIVEVMNGRISNAEDEAFYLQGRLMVPMGIGRGLAQLPTRAPRIYEWLRHRLGLDRNLT